MSNEEAQKVLNELQSVRPEMLNRKAKRLFEAIMKIADQRDELKKTCYAMAEYIAKLDIDEDICKKMGIFKDCEIKDVENCKKCIIKYFKKKYK